MTDAERCDVTDLSDRAGHLLRLEDSQVSAGIPPEQYGGNGPAVWQAHADLPIAFNRMLGRDNHARTPVYTARWQAWAGVHGHNTATRTLDGCSQLLGKRQQRAGAFR